jgi:hypothetical protein
MWDFFRCQKCQGVFTYEQERIRLDHMRRIGDTAMYICCTSHKYQPTFPTRYEWLKPNVFIYTAKLVLARGLAPWADKHCRWLLPLIEPFVKNALTR